MLPIPFAKVDFLSGFVVCRVMIHSGLNVLYLCSVEGIKKWV